MENKYQDSLENLKGIDILIYGYKWHYTDTDYVDDFNVLQEAINKLGQIEDLLEKYGIENVDQLDFQLKQHFADWNGLKSQNQSWKAQVERCHKELKEYKDLEELFENDLLKTIEAISKEIYVIDYEEGIYRIEKYKVVKILGMFKDLQLKGDGDISIIPMSGYNKTYFLTKEEAEKKLEEMK